MLQVREDSDVEDDRYPGAKVEADGRGPRLYRSCPPILPKELKAIS
jgi:hypothetical protein